MYNRNTGEGFASGNDGWGYFEQTPPFENQKSYLAGKELGSWAPDRNTQGRPKKGAWGCPAFHLQATGSLTEETERWFLSTAFNSCLRRERKTWSPECAKEGGTRWTPQVLSWSPGGGNPRRKSLLDANQPPKCQGLLVGDLCLLLLQPSCLPETKRTLSGGK